MKAEPQSIELTSEKIQEFKKAFRSPSNSIPPTVYSIALKGVFDLVNALQVDWKNLLHATQEFIYHDASPQIPVSCLAQSKLMDCRFRANTYWLQFETEISAKTESRLLVTSKTLLLVKKDESQ